MTNDPDKVKKGDRVEITDGPSKGIIAEVLWEDTLEDQGGYLYSNALFIKVVEGPKMFQQFYVRRGYAKKKEA